MASTTSLFTGLSGLVANSRRLDVIGNNISNVNTTAFKSTRMAFSPSFSRSFSLGSSPGATTGGSNPSQIGLGVTVASTQRNFNNGPIGGTGVATDVAIEGDGFFIVDSAGAQNYTRAGNFLRNPQNDLVTQTGARVLGYAVNEQFNIEDGNLAPISIPIGTLTVAEATRSVNFNGNLNAGGAIATTGTVLEGRAWFTDAALTIPVTAATDITTTDIYMSDGLGGSLLAFDSTANPKMITFNNFEKGGKSIEATTFAFNGTAVAGAQGFGNTLGDLADFMEDVLGLDNTNVGASSNLGGSVTINASGQLVITGNEGTAQALGPDSVSITVSGAGSGLSQPLQLNRTASADGESVRTSFIVYDSLGTAVTIDLTFVLQATTISGGTTWQLVAESDDTAAMNRIVGLAEVTFDNAGRFESASNQTLTLIRDNGAVSPMQLTLDLDSETYGVSSLADQGSSLAAVFQDGSPIGTLSNFSIGEDGRISGSFTNGLTRTIGQIAIAKFTNPEGLVDLGDNLFGSGPNSGTAFVTRPREFGTGRLVGSALEQSNVDLSQEFINMILASTGYSAASRVITTTDELITQLLALGR
ncbi:MAG: flagellar hook-basal body complex protein [Phycisphaera sp.]|nr:flagellar hook-basal body complex protein [Phycisphaera sp.]